MRLSWSGVVCLCVCRKELEREIELVWCVCVCVSVERSWSVRLSWSGVVCLCVCRKELEHEKLLKSVAGSEDERLITERLSQLDSDINAVR